MHIYVKWCYFLLAAPTDTNAFICIVFVMPFQITIVNQFLDFILVFFFSLSFSYRNGLWPQTSIIFSIEQSLQYSFCGILSVALLISSIGMLLTVFFFFHHPLLFLCVCLCTVQCSSYHLTFFREPISIFFGTSSQWWTFISIFIVNLHGCEKVFNFTGDEWTNDFVRERDHAREQLKKNHKNKWIER